MYSLEIYKCLTELVCISADKQLQLAGSPHAYYSPREMFLREYCTIKLSTARQTGHTEALLGATGYNTCFSPLFKNTLFLFDTPQERRTFNDRLLKITPQSNHPVICSTIDHCKPHKSISYDIKPFDSLVVENASCITTEQEKRVYEIAQELRTTTPFYIVFLH